MSSYRLLIADDENTIRKGLADYIPWDTINCTVIGAARDGEEAVELIKSVTPDIIITDIKMPRMDGIGVAKYVHENYPLMKVIILSGYAEFEYARSAIGFGVSDYMLKPVSKDKLIETVQNVITHIDQEREKQKIIRNEESRRREVFLQELIHSQPGDGSLERAVDFGIALDTYYVIIFEASGTDDSFLDYVIENLTTRYTEEYVFTSGSRVFWVSTIDDTKLLADMCTEIADISRLLYAHSVFVGISRRHRGLAELSIAAAEAEKALAFHFYSTQWVSFYTNKAVMNQDMHPFYLEALVAIEQHLKKQKMDDALLNMQELFSHIKSLTLPEFDVKTLCIQIYYICSRVAVLNGLKLPLQTGGIDFFILIRDSLTIHTLLTVMEKLFKAVGSSIFNEGRNLSLPVKKAWSYIQQHTDGDLSLEKIASEIHINPSHLSRIFKKELNESVTEYVTKLKIENAKELLSFSDMLTYEVAEAVGFNDASYFSQVFKKITGVSPKDFKIQDMQRLGSNEQ